MKIKLVKEAKIGETLVPNESIIEIGEVDGKSLIESGTGIIYDEAVSEVEIQEVKKIIKEINMSDEVKVEKTEIKDTGFKNFGEFLGAVVKAGRDGQVDSRLISKSTGQNETTPADGGYTVTTDIASFITQQAQSASVLAAKCSKMEIGPLMTGIKIPQVNETTRSVTTLYGGVRVYSPAEGVAKTPFKQAYTQKDIQLKKLCAVNYLTDELLQDNTSLESFIRMNVGKAFGWTIDNEIILGTLGAATAIVNHAATVEQAFAGDHPTPAEITAMYTRNLNRTRAEWFLSGDQYANIISLATTGTFPLFQPNFAVAPAGSLLGRPINVIEQGGAAGDESSFMFLDLSDYLLIGKGGIQEARSIHVKFLEDETALRFTLRFGGAPLMASVVTMPDGLSYSSFVTRD